jgi:hypothetical protein
MPTSSSAGTYQWSIDGVNVGTPTAYSGFGIGQVDAVYINTNNGTADNFDLHSQHRLDSVSLALLPEPTSAGLVGVGGMSLLARRRNRRAA